jgi:hypothetical protein
MGDGKPGRAAPRQVQDQGHTREKAPAQRLGGGLFFSHCRVNSPAEDPPYADPADRSEEDVVIVNLIERVGIQRDDALGAH